MKKFVFLLSLGFLIISCEKNEGTQTKDWTNKTPMLRSHNEAKVTISEGVWGTVVKTEGDCMPMVGEVDNRNPRCKQYPVIREIYVYEYTTFDDVDNEFITKVFEINTELIVMTTSDVEGFFELKLEPGVYSVFVKEEDYLYVNSFDGKGGLSPVTVKASTVSERLLDLDYASH